MSTRKALTFSFLDRYSGLVLAVISSMILARLLTPAEIGVFSVTMVLLSFIGNLRDLGAGQYLLQEKELTQERIRATWTVQLALGLVFTIVTLCASVPVAIFYNEPRMRNIMLVLALNFAITPFGSLTYAWLMRELRFESLAVIRFTNSLTGACVSVGFAWKGYGPISLAFGSLAATFVGACFATFFRPTSFPWLPGFKEIKRVLSFGGKLTVTTVLNTIGSSTPELLLGKLQSLTQAGLYSRAQGLLGMFSKLVLEATHAVALPLFSKESRETGTINATYLRAISYISVLGWSFFLCIIFLAHPIIRLLYGSQWDSAVEFTRLLAIAMLIGLPSALSGPALMATGNIKSVVRATILTISLYIPLAAAGAFFGLIPLGIAAIVSAIINVSIWLHLTQKKLGFHWPDFWNVLIQSSLVALLSAIVPVGAFLYFGPYPSSFLIPLAVGISGSIILFLIAVQLTKHPILEELIGVRKKIIAILKKPS